MHCILIANPGPQSHLYISEQPIPKYGKDDLLIQVKATAVNRADLLQRQGKYPPPAGESAIPGLEIAGKVVAMGSAVRNFNLGDCIYGLVGSGGYGQYCCINKGLATGMPQDWDFSYAAALPEALVTSHATIFLLGQLKAEERLLIHGAGSGISSLAIQMAVRTGAKVFSTVSSKAKLSKASQLGASLINYKEDDFEVLLGEKSMDLIVDFIGGSYFPKHLRLLRSQGKLIQIAAMQGYLVETNLLFLLQKRLQVHGFVLRSQSISEKILLWQSMQNIWGQPLATRQIAPIIDSVFSFEEIELAHARLSSNNHFGKIVITID